MQDLIDYIFVNLNSIWNLIKSNYLLSISFLTIIFGFVISVINNTDGNNRKG